MIAQRLELRLVLAAIDDAEHNVSVYFDCFADSAR